jgi:hypothetical protein
MTAVVYTNSVILTISFSTQQDRQGTYNVTLRGVRVTNAAVQKQLILIVIREWLWL